MDFRSAKVTLVVSYQPTTASRCGHFICNVCSGANTINIDAIEIIASMRLRLNRRIIQTPRHKIVKQAKPGYLQSSQHWGSSITLNLVSNRRSNMRIATQYRHCFHLADLVGKAPTLSWLHLARLIIPFIAQVKAWIGKAEVQSKNLFKVVTPSIDSSRQKVIAVCSIFSTLQYCIYWSIPIHNRVLFLRYSPQLFDGGADSGCDLSFALNVLLCYAQPSGAQAKLFGRRLKQTAE